MVFSRREPARRVIAVLARPTKTSASNGNHGNRSSYWGCVLTRNKVSLSILPERELSEWERLYQLALLELDLGLLPQRIFDAKIAIVRNLARLQTRDAVEERTAMVDALNALKDLTRINQHDRNGHAA